MAKSLIKKDEASMLDALVSLVTSDGKAIDRMIAANARSTASQRKAHAVLAASVVIHAIEYGDVRPAIKFVLSCGHTVRTDALVKWLVNFGPFIYGKDKDTKQDTLKHDGKRADAIKAKYTEDTQSFIVSLIKLPYWEFSPPANPFKPIDLPAMMASVVKRAEKVLEDPEHKDDKGNNFLGLDKLKALVLEIAPAKLQVKTASATA